MDALIHKLENDDTQFLTELDSQFKQLCKKRKQNKQIQKKANQ